MATVLEIAKAPARASLELAAAPTELKNAALMRLAELLLENAPSIIEANARDLEKAEKAGLSKPMLERLSLDERKIAAMADGVRQVAALPIPWGRQSSRRVRPNG